MTTPRENLLKVFRHETPGWIPITGHIDPYNQPWHLLTAASVIITIPTMRRTTIMIITLNRPIFMSWLMR